MAMASGWYKREFDAVGVPFEQRGKIMDENLDILKRFWTEDMVKGEWTHHKIPAGVMYPKPVQKPRPPHPDRRLRGSRAQARGGRRRRLADLFLSARELRQVVGEDPQLRQGSRQRPRHADERRAAAHHDRHVPRRRRSADDGMARQGMGLRVVERLDQGQRHHRHGRRVRRAAQGAPRRRRAEAHLRALQVRDEPDRDHRQRDHSATQGVPGVRRAFRPALAFAVITSTARINDWCANDKVADPAHGAHHRQTRGTAADNRSDSASALGRGAWRIRQCREVRRAHHELPGEDGFAGDLFPISRHQAQILGRKAYAGIGALPSAPDVAILAVPGGTLQQNLNEAAEAGVGCCVIISTGFAELDQDGAQRQATIVDLAATTGMRILGPNCMGMIVPHHKMALCSSVTLNTDTLGGRLHRSHQPERRADGFDVRSRQGRRHRPALWRFVRQPERSRDLRLYRSHGARAGDARDLRLCRGFVDAARFRQSAIACRRADSCSSCSRPACTAAGVIAAQSHTASLAGSFEAFSAICREHGVLLPKRTHDMMRTAHLLTRFPGRRSVAGIGVVSSSGGGAGIPSDRLSEAGLPLAIPARETIDKLEVMLLPPQAQNPIDLGGRRQPETVDITKAATATLLADPNVGYGLAMLNSMPFYAKRTMLIAEAVRECGKPVLVALTVGALADEARRELRQRDIFYVDSFEDALRVLDGCCWRKRTAHGLARDTSGSPCGPACRVRFFWRCKPAFETESEVKRLLAAYGITVAKEMLVATPEDAGKAAAQLGFPVV